MQLSIIIPVYNEIDSLKKFTKKIINSFKDENVEYIFVNDGSNDGSKEWLEKYKTDYLSNSNEDNFFLINLPKNKGKGAALIKGIEAANGNYVLFQDSDLELDPIDSHEMYQLIKKNPDMKVLFGSRYLSGKVKSNKNFINELFVRLNSLIFNILFNQSISDLHCGTKILAKEILEKIKLTIKDFGIEIDIASQIAKNNFRIYEYGISYFSRSKFEGKKITWIDGILCYYYFFKVRFVNNDNSIIISIIYSSIYMVFIGSYFSMGYGKLVLMMIFFIIGSFVGLYRKIFSSSLVFLFIYIGSLFSKGNGKIYTVILGFILGIYISKILSLRINRMTNNKFINFVV